MEVGLQKEVLLFGWRAPTRAAPREPQQYAMGSTAEVGERMRACGIGRRRRQWQRWRRWSRSGSSTALGRLVVVDRKSVVA